MSGLPALLGGKYRPLRLIGQGGMGMVYEVVHENTGEHLALKLLLSHSRLTPDLLERFRREARATTSVKSDHVVRVTDADVAPELEGAPFLVMELLEGQNFEDLCQSRQPSQDECLDWLRQIGRALDKAHRHGIVHRDLKPANLFLAKREELLPIVKVLDFGIAKVLGETGSPTVSGQILGTPRYMAPEQAGQGTIEVSAATDRYALGLIAFRLLLGRDYFKEGHVMKVLLEVGRGPTFAPSQLGSRLGAAFDAWFARACAVAPDARFDTCFEQTEALAQALDMVLLAPATGDSSPPDSRASDASRPASSGDGIEPAPTLAASIVTSRFAAGAAPLRRALFAAAVLCVLALLVLLGLRAGQPQLETKAASFVASSTMPSIEGSSAVALDVRAPAGQPAPALQREPSTGEALIPTLPDSAVAPSELPHRAPSPPGSAKGRGGAAAKKAPKDSVWDEP